TGPARVDAGRLAPRLDGAVVDRQVAVGHDELRVDLLARAQAVALDAHAQRRVERQRLRRGLGQADAAAGAGALRRVGPRALLARDEAADLPAARAHRRLDAVRQARPLRGVERQPVDDDLDGVLLLLLQPLHLVEADDHAVDAHAGEAGLARLVEELAELAL